MVALSVPKWLRCDRHIRRTELSIRHTTGSIDHWEVGVDQRWVLFFKKVHEGNSQKKYIWPSFQISWSLPWNTRMETSVPNIPIFWQLPSLHICHIAFTITKVPILNTSKKKRCETWKKICYSIRPRNTHDYQHYLTKQPDSSNANGRHAAVCCQLSRRYLDLLWSRIMRPYYTSVVLVHLDPFLLLNDLNLPPKEPTIVQNNRGGFRVPTSMSRRQQAASSPTQSLSLNVQCSRKWSRPWPPPLCQTRRDPIQPTDREGWAGKQAFSAIWYGLRAVW